MTRSPLSRRQLLVGSALLPALVACATTPPARVFTLVSRPPATPYAGRSPATVIVKSVDLAKYLDRPQIVRYSDTYELQLSEFERWGEGMRDMVIRILVENLAMRLPHSQVLAGSASLTVPADATVEVDISRFDADPSGVVILAARWAVERETQKTPHLQFDRISVAEPTTPTTQLVAAMSDALGQLSDRIAASLTA
jgi:uncharacterized lipoprotein YmbA